LANRPTFPRTTFFIQDAMKFLDRQSDTSDTDAPQRRFEVKASINQSPCRGTSFAFRSRGEPT